MASTFRINRISAAAASRDAAEKLVTQVLYEVEFAAKAAVLGGPYSTGILAASIHRVGPTFVPLGVTGRVGSRLKYAMSVESGAKVHWIFPKHSSAGAHRAMLRFYWRRAGKVVYFPQIPASPFTVGRSHPGQPGQHYLTNALRRSARLHNMRVETLDI